MQERYPPPAVGPGGRQTHFCAIHSPKSVKTHPHAQDARTLPKSGVLQQNILLFDIHVS